MNYESGPIRDEQLALEGGPAPSRRKRRIAVIAGLIAVIAGLFVIFGRGGDDKPAGAAPGRGAEQAPPVTVIAPGRQTIDRVISANGSLAARREMPVGVAGEGGRVTRVLVEPGQWVRAGQVLATVDRSVQAQTAESLAAQIRVAEADAKLAEAQLNRAQALVANGFVSRADIETRTANRDAAFARVRVARAQLGQQRAATSRLDIRAPAAGLVLTRQVEPGQIVSAGSGVLFRMAQGGEMEMRAALSEGDLAGLRTIARIALPYNVALRPGGFATAAIVGGASTVPQLPETAVQTDRTGNFVYVVGSDDRAVKRPVKTGGVTDQGVLIVEGLNGTERVVVAAGAFLSPGQKVKPLVQGATPAPAVQKAS
jgi:multidrug efflux pump subunit AcrA (membrane-fusion protein)